MSWLSECVADGALGVWLLDETSGTSAADSAGSNTGSYNGAPTLGVSGAPAGMGAAVQTGAASSVSLPSTASPDITVEVWFKWVSGNIVWRDNTSAGGTGYFINLGGTSLVMRYGGADRTIAGVTSASLKDGNYHQVVLAGNDAANTVKTYIDGALVDTWAGSPQTGTEWISPLRLGLNGSTTQYQPNAYAGAAFFHSELSAARVAAHYTAGTTAPAPTLSLSASLRPKVAAFTVHAVGAPDRTVTLDGLLGPKFATLSLLGGASAALDGTLRSKTAAFSLFAPGAADREVSLSGTLPPKTLTSVARAITPVEPAPASVTKAAATSPLVAVAHGAATMVGTSPVYAVSKTQAPRPRQQIVVDGVDVTYFRGVPTPDVDYTLLEPLLYGPGRLDLPQVRPYLGDTPGAGDLTWLRPQAPVEVNLVVDDTVVQRDVYKGFIAAFDISGGALSVELGGEANGRAAMRDRQVPIFPRINDIGHQMADAVRDLGLPHYPSLGAVTGIETMTTGGTGHLDHINDLVAKSWTRSGKQWTVMPNAATGAYETHRKDATTIHATAFVDDVHTVATLRRDIAEEPNQVFVTCVTPAGMRVRFGKYPELVQGPVPEFPGLMAEGDSGEGVRLLVGKLHASGYLKLTEVAGGFDEDVTRGVKALQDDAGLPETGVVNLATWRALYDLDVTGLSLEWANIQPAAQRRKTRKFNRSANGTIMGFNPDYDPDVIVRHRSIDLGSGVTRSQAREFARTVLHDSDAANWVGDIKFNTGALIRGEGSEGMTLTPADVMDARELRPGMNLWLPQFDGGTLLHISACQVDGDGIVTATVDTRFRDAMEVWEVIARNKESRNDPSRHRARRYRASTIVKDSIGEWDEIGGLLGVDLTLKAGWNTFPVVAAMAGQIQRLRVILDNPMEFAVAVFGTKITDDRLNNLIPAPLTVSGTKDWERSTIDAVLQDHLILYSAGTHDEPCGYGRGRKSDGDPITGVFNDSAGFSYFAEDRTVVWVAVWVAVENLIPTGRIMWPQLEAGV